MNDRTPSDLRRDYAILRRNGQIIYAGRCFNTAFSLIPEKSEDSYSYCCITFRFGLPEIRFNKNFNSCLDPTNYAGLPIRNGEIKLDLLTEREQERITDAISKEDLETLTSMTQLQSD